MDGTFIIECKIKQTNPKETKMGNEQTIKELEAKIEEAKQCIERLKKPKVELKKGDWVCSVWEDKIEGFFHVDRYDDSLIYSKSNYFCYNRLERKIYKYIRNQSEPFPFILTPHNYESLICGVKDGYWVRVDL